VTARWVLRSTPASAAVLGGAGYAEPLASLLAQRGVTTAVEAAAFLAPSLERLSSAGSIAGLTVAAEIIGRHVARGDGIAILGDYDADGVTATALLVATLKKLGADTGWRLPRRDAEGYGLQPVHVEWAKREGAGLLVAVDSGSTAFDAWRAADEIDLPLVVVDHHLPAAEAAPVSSRNVHLVNPRLSGAPEEARHLTAAGLAARLAAVLFESEGGEPPWDSLARLAAIGTVADVALLVGDNRQLVAHGLKSLPRTPSPGLRALYDLASLRAPFRASDIAFRLAPRINAAGRLGAADDALELLLTSDPDRARRLARLLEERNAERRSVEEGILDEARRQIDGRSDIAPIVVLWSPQWHRGVVGVAAAKLARELRRPVLLLAEEGETATGSGRSVPELDLHALLRPTAGDLERFGGHSQAVGLTARTSRLPDLRDRWEDAAAAQEELLGRHEIEYDADLPLASADERLLDQISQLEPYGAGNPEPIFRLRSCRVAGEVEAFGRGHLKFRIESGGARGQVLAWEGAGLDRGALTGELDLLAAVERDRYVGIRFRKIDFRSTSTATD